MVGKASLSGRPPLAIVMTKSCVTVPVELLADRRSRPGPDALPIAPVPVSTRGVPLRTLLLRSKVRPAGSTLLTTVTEVAALTSNLALKGVPAVPEMLGDEVKTGSTALPCRLPVSV